MAKTRKNPLMTTPAPVKRAPSGSDGKIKHRWSEKAEADIKEFLERTRYSVRQHYSKEAHELCKRHGIPYGTLENEASVSRPAQYKNIKCTQCKKICPTWGYYEHHIANTCAKRSNLKTTPVAATAVLTAVSEGGKEDVELSEDLPAEKCTFDKPGPKGCYGWNPDGTPCPSAPTVGCGFKKPLCDVCCNYYWRLQSALTGTSQFECKVHVHTPFAMRHDRMGAYGCPGEDSERVGQLCRRLADAECGSVLCGKPIALCRECCRFYKKGDCSLHRGPHADLKHSGNKRKTSSSSSSSTGDENPRPEKKLNVSVESPQTADPVPMARKETIPRVDGPDTPIIRDDFPAEIQHSIVRFLLSPTPPPPPPSLSSSSSSSTTTTQAVHSTVLTVVPLPSPVSRSTSVVSLIDDTASTSDDIEIGIAVPEKKAEKFCAETFSILDKAADDLCRSRIALLAQEEQYLQKAEARLAQREKMHEEYLERGKRCQEGWERVINQLRSDQMATKEHYDGWSKLLELRTAQLKDMEDREKKFRLEADAVKKRFEALASSRMAVVNPFPRGSPTSSSTSRSPPVL